MSIDKAFEAALRGSLDDLLGALDLQPLGDDRFKVPSTSAQMLDRIYGGQLLAEALVAAASTVADKAPSSLHASFVKAGNPGQPMEIAVDRVRDGRSMATRQVTVLQDDRALLVAIVSFHTNATEPDVSDPVPATAPPDEMPLLQEWASELPPGQRDHGQHWIERPPPVEMRLPEPPTFFGGSSPNRTRSHWIRLPRDVGDDPALHTALLTYASDFLLMDMVFRAHPAGMGPGNSNGFSLDHAIWFHRPVQFDRWHLYTQEALTIVGARGLARGAIHDADGRLTASVAQEVLVLPVSQQGSTA